MRPLVNLSREGAGGYRLPELVVPKTANLPDNYMRHDLNLPQLTEHDVIREFMERSHSNVSVDETKLFPLGSCTMIYTPAVARMVAEYAALHLSQPDHTTQGALRLMYDLEVILSEIGGAAQGTLQPIAGAHSELTALFMIHAYHESRNDQRKYILIPDSAHGTNPASAAMAGYKVINIPSRKDGRLDIEALSSKLSEKEDGTEIGKKSAAFMITQPSTFGIYDENIKEITALLHEYGIQVFCDGANLAALTNRVKFIELGVDAYHNNLHKTFGVPHGGGGPGAGFVGVAAHLVPFLPVPVIEERNGKYVRSYDKPLSIGSVSGTDGNFLADVMALKYILLMGADGLREGSGVSVLDGNYLHILLSRVLPAAFNGWVMHEGIVKDTPLKALKAIIENDGGISDKTKERGLTVIDLVKGLIDLGYYAPTVGFPIHDGILTEPTHSARKADMDKFAEDLAEIVRHATEDPVWLATAPHNTPIRRAQQAEANRHPVFIWKN